MGVQFGDIDIMTGTAECGPGRRLPSNRERKIMRIWRAELAVSYYLSTYAYSYTH